MEGRQPTLNIAASPKSFFLEKSLATEAYQIRINFETPKEEVELPPDITR